MSGRATYLNYIRLLFAGILVLAGWLPVQLWQAQGREQMLFRLCVSATPEQSGLPGAFSGEILEQMDELPGVRRRWAFYCADAEICVDKYHASAELWGVELSEYPLTIVRSAGEKKTGIRPLLLVGKSFFEGLSDEYGNLISDRQAKILEEQMDSLAVRIAVNDAAGKEEKIPANGGETETFQDAEISGIAEENGVYMDADQMKCWLIQKGLPCEIRRVELEIQGERNVQKTRENLKKAGFSLV